MFGTAFHWSFFLSVMAVIAAAPTGAATGDKALRLSSTAFGRTIRIEVRDLEPGTNREAILAAIGETRRVESLTDPSGSVAGGLGELNSAAGGEAVQLDPALLQALARANDFCRWSKGAYGPLGGRLYDLWGLRRPVAAKPLLEALHTAVVSAGCDRLALDTETGSARRAEDSRLDLWGIAQGKAVDRAVAILREHGAENGYVQLGSIHRGFGEGPDGEGWVVTLPVLPGASEPLGQVYLRDQALAISHYQDRVLTLADETFPPYLDQRKGRPVRGVVAVAAVTELATDAQGVATSLFILGEREGRFRAGNLTPHPAVRWLLGTGDGHPLITDYRWSKVSKR